MAKIKLSTTTKLSEIENEQILRGELLTLKKHREALAADDTQIEENIATIEDNVNCGQMDPDIGKMKILNLQKKQEEIRIKLDDVEARMDDIQRQLSEEQRNFDKKKCIDNIRELLKTSDTRIGQIEKEAKCTTGYLSRLEKEGNKSDPSIEFLCTAANLLGVTLDSLVNGDFASITPTEQYLLNFVSSMIKDTKTDDIVWSRETAATLNRVDYFLNPPETSHPLFKIYEDIGCSGYPEPMGTEYNSMFLVDEHFLPFRNSYNAKLPNMEDKVYLMSIHVPDVTDEILELYIVDESDNVNPICCTAETCQIVVDAINALYKEIELSSSHVHISRETKSVIDRYINTKKTMSKLE